MRPESCADLDELRSAYVDGALGDSDRERLLAHLVDCADCRRDVAEIDVAPRRNAQHQFIRAFAITWIILRALFDGIVNYVFCHRFFCVN